MEAVLNDFNTAARRLKWSNSNITINLEYNDIARKTLFFLLSDGTRNWEFTLTYKDNYPQTGVVFNADWIGNCNTHEYCYWTNKVSQEINNKNTKVDQAINIIVNWYNKTLDEQRKLQKLLTGDYLQDGEFEEYDEYIESAPLMLKPVDLKNLYISLLHKYRDSDIKLQLESEGNLSLTMTIGNNKFFFNIYMNMMNSVTPPIITLSKPRIKFDGIFPITPYGLLVLKNINPKEWPNWAKNQINTEKDIDIINEIRSTFSTKYFELDTFQEPYDPKESLIGYERLRTDLNLGLLTEKMIAQPKRDDGNDINLPESILNFIINNNLGIEEKPVFQLETNTGLKTICGMGESHRLGNGLVFIPDVVMKNLLIKGQTTSAVTVSFVVVPIADLITIRPVEEHGLDNIDKNVLETGFSKYTVLTEGEIVEINGVQIEIVECKPAKSVRLSRLGFTEVNFNPIPSIRESKPQTRPQQQTRADQFDYGPLTVSPYEYESEEEDEEEEEVGYGFKATPPRVTDRILAGEKGMTSRFQSSRGLSLASPTKRTSPQQQRPTTSQRISPRQQRPTTSQRISPQQRPTTSQRISPQQQPTTSQRISPQQQRPTTSQRISPQQQRPTTSQRISPQQRSPSQQISPYSQYQDYTQAELEEMERDLKRLEEEGEIFDDSEDVEGEYYYDY
jgi:formylmethanofuran dehydrogenase subunit D